MTNNAEEMRGRCKTKTNIKLRREVGMTKIDGVDGDENEETDGRESARLTGGIRKQKSSAQARSSPAE